MAEPGATETPIITTPRSERRQVPENERIEGYIRRILEVSKERFFDTGQSETLAMSDAERIPGYLSLVAISNPQQDMEVAIRLHDGLTGTGGLTAENIGGGEFHISYRQLRGGRLLPRTIRKRMGYDWGIIIVPSGRGESNRITNPVSRKSTMRPSDIKNWEEGDTTVDMGIGTYPGQSSLHPSLAGYQAILDTVTDGIKDEDLTKKSIETSLKINTIHKWERKGLAEAQANLNHRYEQIKQAEVMAVESAQEARSRLELARAREKDHYNDHSFDTGAQRLRMLAQRFRGNDALVINEAAYKLTSIGASIDMVRTLLESDDPRVKKAVREVRTDRSEALLTPSEMYHLAHFIAEHPEFSGNRERAGFTDDVIFGTLLDHTPLAEGKKNDLEASQEAKIAILEALEFLRPGESLAQRLDRIGGFPVYAVNRSGQTTGVVNIFREDSDQGESVVWDPYYLGHTNPNIRITSPLFGPHFMAMVMTDLQMTNDGEKNRLKPATGKINYITCRFEGGLDHPSEDMGGAMMRLSKDLKKDSGTNPRLLNN